MPNPSPFAKRGDKETVENGWTFMPKFDGQGLMPAVTVDAESGAVLMLAYMNEEALKLTIETGEAHYWSRSRGELWRKGATSGNTQKVEEIRTDCDQDTILLRVHPKGPACHVGHRSCFYRTVESVDDLRDLDKS